MSSQSLHERTNVQRQQPTSEHEVRVTDITSLRARNSRLALLSDVAADLLAAKDPNTLIRELFQTIAVQFGLDVCFNYMVTQTGDALQLDAYVGIPEDDAERIKRLAFGEAVCGTVAQTRRSMNVSNVQQKETPLVDLINSYGVRAYACYPLAVDEHLLGTLSFGTRNRDEFSEADLMFFQVICQYVSMAKARLRAEEALHAYNEALEQQVAERTTDLQRANQLLTQRNRELQDFAYIASHDLQEPLRKIRTFGNLLGSKYCDRLGDTGMLYVQRMQNAAERMSHLLEDLLLFSRVATHGKPYTTVDLRSVVDTVITDLDLVIEETDTRIEVTSLPTIDADPTQMRRLLQSLIDNAIKFRDPERTPLVRVFATVQQTDHDGIVRDDAGEQCVLVVEDNGIGFEEEHADRIFDPFQRLHGRSAYSGTGMGLAIARRIVERHGGTISAESTPGVGSRLIVRLPTHQHVQGE